MLSTKPIAHDEAVALFEKKDYVKAFEAFSSLAKTGDEEVLKKLGIMYFLGLGVERNLEYAYDNLLISANAGNQAAVYYCAKINYLQCDFLSAIEKLRFSIEEKFIPSYYLLGWLLLNRAGLNDKKEGLEFISRAAKAGHVKAMGYKVRLILKGKYGFWGYVAAPCLFLKVIFYAMYLSIKDDGDSRLLY